MTRSTQPTSLAIRCARASWISRAMRSMTNSEATHTWPASSGRARSCHLLARVVESPLHPEDLTFATPIRAYGSGHEQRFKQLHSRSARRLVALNELVTMDLSACASKSRTTIRICVRTMLYWLAFGISPTVRD
jgi:hypothetical protein